jgi:hypothetical protein
VSRRRIFCFGSNRLGIHGAGAARFAADHYGAQRGVGEGLTGECYALPTCSAPGAPLPLDEIRRHAEAFTQTARARPNYDFLLTAVGCGIAGNTPAEILPLFGELPDNVYVQARLARGGAL